MCNGIRNIQAFLLTLSLYNMNRNKLGNSLTVTNNGLCKPFAYLGNSFR